MATKIIESDRKKETLRNHKYHHIFKIFLTADKLSWLSQKGYPYMYGYIFIYQSIPILGILPNFMLNKQD